MCHELYSHVCLSSAKIVHAKLIGNARSSLVLLRVLLWHRSAGDCIHDPLYVLRYKERLAPGLMEAMSSSKRAKFRLPVRCCRIATPRVAVHRHPLQCRAHLPVCEYPGHGTQPHVFDTADAALRGLRVDMVPQSIVIVGESGAGKTEAMKIVRGVLLSSSCASGFGTCLSVQYLQLQFSFYTAPFAASLDCSCWRIWLWHRQTLVV